MKKLKTSALKSLCSTLILLIAYLCLPAQETVWQNCLNCKTTKISYFVDSSDRDFRIRAEFIVNTPIQLVLGAITDYEHYANWVYNCEKTELCSKDKASIVYRQIISVPFPYKDSEAFLELKISNLDNSFVIVQNCIPDFKPINAKYERITRYQSVWKLTKPSENQTHILWYAETGGPKGMSAIEKKMFLCYAPSKTIRNLTKYISSNKIKTR